MVDIKLSIIYGYKQIILNILRYDYKGYSSYCAKNRNGCGKWTCQCDTELAKVILELTRKIKPSTNDINDDVNLYII